MKIGKGEGSVSIPVWALVVGALILDNVVANICNTVTDIKVNKTK